jgi:hypothetical protein
MPVQTPRADYTAMADSWQTCRDALEGSAAIKAAGTKYLPLLEGMSASGISGVASAYASYVLRAMYYPAIGRTVAGLAGLVFGKRPTVAGVPKAQEADFADVTLNGVSLGAYAITLCREILTTGRAGTLIDFPDGVTPGARPYWLLYPAEAIVNWRVDRVAGRQVLTLLVLKEAVEVEKADDPFTADTVTQYRVLQLIDARCVVTVYRESGEHKGTFVAGEPRIPLRRGVALPFLPFVFLGPGDTSADVDQPPLQDLVDVNLSHYRTSADREHGAHWTALPTPYITGHELAAGETLSIGSGKAWVLPNPAASAGMVEFTGAGLAALKDLMEEKRQLMATLGARMLETQKNTQEAAETVRLRHAGEASALSLLATALGQAITQAIRWHLFWAGLEPTTADKATVTMNPEILDELSADDLRALVTSWQAGAIAKKTVYYNLTWGEWARPDVTFEQEEADIARENDNLDLPTPPPIVP